ncbi:MFS transporter [Gayadomonas joobiniege]|uniref:MFS transporter n=1 Tax=Gayadomonas joobiniege TaxID=1234606 RepID=UPI00036AF30E|nr:MFS transporter [Gayadomonas joobiniege]
MSNALTGTEKKIAAVLAGVFSLRMLGLFMIMPVIAVYGQSLQGISPLWIGLIIGAYGLTQALLQIPMGLLSDKIGRRPVIILGLTLFAIGSLIAATADHVYWVTLGRFLQGMGAIASAVLALAADLTREEQRSKVMAIIGMSIGLSFAAAMVLGPLLAQKIGLDGLFLLTAVFAVLGIILVLLTIPKQTSHKTNRDAVAVPQQLKQLVKNKQLQKLSFGVFFLHLQLTCLFVVVPGILVKAGFESQSHWMLYFPALLASFVVMTPVLLWAMKKNKEKAVFIAAIAALAGAMLFIWLGQNNNYTILAALVLFFAAFNYLEANLPAWVSRIAPAGQKGSAMGMFSSSQFAGAFAGGSLGGVLLQTTSVDGVLIFAATLCLPWILISYSLQLPKRTRPRVVSVTIDQNNTAEQVAEALLQVTGVEEAVVIAEEQQAYLKVLPKQLDERALQNCLKTNS